jgi:hypothetical protein
VLYIPESYALDDQALAALKSYVSNGGTLWADGLTGWKNATGEVRATVPGGLTDVFGVEATDIYPVQPDQPYSVTPQNEQGGELWKLPLQLKGADVVLRTPDVKPFEVHHAFGKGQVYYFESAVALAYARRFNPVVQRWIVDPSIALGRSQQVNLQQGSRKILFRGMLLPAGAAAILTNWGETEKVIVSFRGFYTVADAITGKNLPVTEEDGHTLAAMNLEAGTVAVLKASRQK